MKPTIRLLLALFLAVSGALAPAAFAQEENDRPRVRPLMLSKGHCAHLHEGGQHGSMIRGLGSYGYLGVETTALTPELREHFGVPSDLGVMIGRVEEGSPAEAAGLLVGDVVTRVGDGDVTSGGRLRRLVRRYEKDEEAVVEYWRGGKVATTPVAFGERETCAFDLSSAIDLESFPRIEALPRLELRSLEHALELQELDGERLVEARKRLREALELREHDRESLDEAGQRLREALENQDWTGHLRRIEDVDLSGIEERLHEAMERLHTLEEEIRIEKKRIHEDDSEPDSF